jgi:N-acetylneuraminic acid mutarotase
MKVCSSIVLLLALGFLSAEEPLRIEWEQMPDLPLARRNLKAVCSTTKLHALGGYAQPSEGPEPSHFIYDFTAGSWSEGAVMLTARSNFALVAKGNRVFAIGGDDFLDQGEVYDALATQWKSLPGMSLKRQHLFGEIRDDKIYVPGGLLRWQSPSDQRLCDVLEAFDIKTNTWEQLPKMPTARQSPMISALGQKLYVMGGMDQDRPIPLVEIFDVIRNTWTKGNPLPEKSFYSGSVVFNGLILVLCGAEAGDRQTSILVYDPQRDQWGQATPLPYAIKLTGFTIKGNELYVVGGCDPTFEAVKKVYKGTILK